MRSILRRLLYVVVVLAGKSVFAAAPPDLLVIDEERPWLAALAAPLAGQFTVEGQPPLLIAVTFPPSSAASWLVDHAAVGRGLMLVCAVPDRLGPALEKLPLETLEVSPDPVQAARAIAVRGWTQADAVVLAPVDDSAAMLMAARYAASVRAPLLPCDAARRAETMAWAAEHLSPQQFTWVADPPLPPAELANRSLEQISLAAASAAVVADCGPERIRTLVLARQPDGARLVGRTAWLAPYVAAVRRAPLLLAAEADGLAAERMVFDFIGHHRLKPRTLTIVADYQSLASETIEISSTARPRDETAKPGTPAEPLRYVVASEPCVRSNPPEAAPLGVGRLPSASLGSTSLWFARGLARERPAAQLPREVLLAANPSLDRKPLPLCETISRVTGQEFHNFRLPLSEFYGTPIDSPVVFAAAARAGLILYEGHASYQDLIDASYGRPRVPDEYYEEALDALEHPAAPVAPTDEVELPAPARPTLPPAPDRQGRLKEALPGMPVAVLQSCDSLDDPLLERAEQLGFAGLVGSVTPIHSGSGSMFAHAFTRALLYDNANLGEALRDAQNFLFCLEDLKSQRGMTEQIKSRRVALSFRLWGDPELMVLGPTGRPRGKPVSARWAGTDEITIQVPAKRFPEVHSALYAAHFFPGSQSAGLVKGRADSKQRSVLPSYFFRLPLPPDFGGLDQLTPLADAAGNRAAVRLDPLGRYLYVIYAPDNEKADATIVLKKTSAEALAAKDKEKSSQRSKESSRSKPASGK